MEDSPITADELLDEITEQYLRMVKIPENSVTVPELAERTGSSLETIRCYLNSLVRKGEMKKVKVCGRVYYYKEKDEG